MSTIVQSCRNSDLAALAIDGAVRTATSRDADVQAALLHGWNQNYAQISAGEFAGSLVETRFGCVSLFIESTNQALLQGGALARDTVAVGVPLKIAGAGVFCGMPVGGTALHVFSGKNGFEFYSPPGLVMSGVVVSRKELFAVLSPEEQTTLEARLERAHLTTAEEAATLMMRGFIEAILNLARMSPQLARNPDLGRSLQRTVLSNLAQLLLSCSAACETGARTARGWKIVARAREMVLAGAGTPISIADICQATGVSRRSLQYCFQDVLGISPLEFVRAVRLDRVRGMLRTAHSVTDAAAHWGFWHLGYFSRDYRNMFGELPSEAYRRYHNRYALDEDSPEPRC
jgi:AraC family transcriptional regulator, ethanolamine operon transcriptional activator